MFATIFLDPRLAFLALSALLMGAAVPLAIAWIRLLPEERPPFRFPPSPKAEQSAGGGSVGPANDGHDSFAITLLVFSTLSFLWQVPGLPREFLVSRAVALLPKPWLNNVLLLGRGFFMAIPAVAGVYSLFRPHKIRRTLILAGILIPLLWLTAPWFRAAFLSH